MGFDSERQELPESASKSLSLDSSVEETTGGKFNCTKDADITAGRAGGNAGRASVTTVLPGPNIVTRAARNIPFNEPNVSDTALGS